MIGNQITERENPLELKEFRVGGKKLDTVEYLKHINFYWSDHDDNNTNTCIYVVMCYLVLTFETIFHLCKLLFSKTVEDTPPFGVKFTC